MHVIKRVLGGCVTGDGVVTLKEFAEDSAEEAFLSFVSPAVRRSLLESGLLAGKASLESIAEERSVVFERELESTEECSGPDGGGGEKRVTSFDMEVGGEHDAEYPTQGLSRNGGGSVADDTQPTKVAGGGVVQVVSV